jgi:hypothetical protein
VSLPASPLQGSPLVPPAPLEPPWRSASRGRLHDTPGLLLDRHLRRLARLRNPVEWRMARLLERLDGGSGYLDLGFARLSDYARERLGLTARRVQTLLAMARRLGPLPRVAAAYESGLLSQSQAALVARAAVASDQERWVRRAASLTVRRLTHAVLVAFREREHEVRAAAAEVSDEEIGGGADLFEAIRGAIEAEAANTPGFPSTADGLAASLPDAVVEGLNDTPRLIDLRLRELVAARQTLAWHQGRLLRLVADRGHDRDPGFLSFSSFSRYCQERAGMGGRRAWRLIALDRRLAVLPRLEAAYRAGDLSLARASAVSRVATADTEEDWIRLARSVTVRRLYEEVALAMAAAGEDARPPGLGPDGRVQLSPPRAALARAAAAGGAAPDRVDNDPAEWECADGMLQTFLARSSVRQAPAWRRRHRIFERDGWRCRVPGCSARANLQVHHVVFRAHGGGEDDGNLVTLCTTHHLRGIHQGRLRCHALPNGLMAWEFAPDPIDGAHLRYVEDVAWDAAMGGSADTAAAAGRLDRIP